MYYQVIFQLDCLSVCICTYPCRSFLCIDIHVLRIIRLFPCFQYNFVISGLLSESNQSIALHAVYFLVEFSVIFFTVIRKENRTAVKIQRTLT